MKPPTS